MWEAGFGSGDLLPTQVGVAEAPEPCSAPPTDTDVCKCSLTHLNLNRLHEKAKKQNKNILCESSRTVGSVPNSSLMLAGESNRHAIKPEHKRRHQSKRSWNRALEQCFLYIHTFLLLKSANSCSKQHLYGLVLGAIYTPCLHYFISPSSSSSRLFSTSSSMSIFSPTTSLLECHSSIALSFIFNHLPCLMYLMI